MVLTEPTYLHPALLGDIQNYTSGIRLWEGGVSTDHSGWVGDVCIFSVGDRINVGCMISLNILPGSETIGSTFGGGGRGV